MVGLKDGVQLRGLQPQTVLAMSIAMQVCGLNSADCVFTSVCDGTHSKGSLHYKGLAFDMRTRNMSEIQKVQVHLALKESLGDEYDVILESDHIHCEFDPKGR